MSSNLRSPGRPKRKDQEPSVQETVLIKASMLFMELGYEAVSLQQIAKACGITKASIYYYYKGKPELFTAALTAVMHRVSQRTAALLDQEMSLRERLILLAETKLSRHHADFETIMREARSSLSPEQLNEIHRAEDGIHDILAEHLRQGMESKEIRDMDPLLAAHAISSVLMVGNREIAKGTPAPQLARNIIDMFWLGMKR